MNKLKSYRYEKKFIVPQNSQYLISRSIILNGMMFTKQYENRMINSIYLDSKNLDFFRENLLGINERKKTRIRWYGNLKYNKNLFFEIKRKKNQLGLKEVFEIENSIQINNDIFPSMLFLNLFEFFL